MIVIKNLHAQVQGESLFKDVSVVFRRGDRIGIVGPNGSGKTTLLRIIAGEVEPDAGSIRIEQERIGYLPQDFPFPPEATVIEFLELIPVEKRLRLLKEVGLARLDPATLLRDCSGGEKRRLALLRVLSTSPTLLLLDEPTNHLDRTTILWLQSYLESFAGGIILVSHDRSILDVLTHKILEIDPRSQSIKEYMGNYSAYRIERLKRDELQNEAYRLQQKEKKRLEAWLVKKREEAHVHADPRKGKQIKAKEKYLEREILDKALKPAGADKHISGAYLHGEVHNAKRICRVEQVSKCFGTKTIFRDVSFDVYGKERVLITGDNGSGKTTLLRILMNEVQPDSGSMRIGVNVSVGYFSQGQESLNHAHTVLESFLDTPNLVTTKDPRAILGSFLFSDQDVFKKIPVLSLGERVRLIFAKLTCQKNELLILDEPTNHLDIPSREVIEDALRNYEGAIIAVSHDHFFTEAVGFDRIIHIQNGIVREEL